MMMRSLDVEMIDAMQLAVYSKRVASFVRPQSVSLRRARCSVTRILARRLPSLTAQLRKDALRRSALSSEKRADTIVFHVEDFRHR